MALPRSVKYSQLAVALFLGGCRSGTAPTHVSGSRDGSQKTDRVHLQGVLVEGGAECQRFRASDNRYYTLEGDLRGFRTGDNVEITGTVPQVTHCMQDTTIHVETISRDSRVSVQRANISVYRRTHCSVRE